MDGRLWICGVAVAIAMFGLLWDFLYPFPLSRPVLILCSGTAGAIPHLPVVKSVEESSPAEVKHE